MNNIGWCDKTVNPVTGCPNGCAYCYARDMNKRFGWVKDFSKPEFFPERLKGFSTREPQIIFIDSMSDIGCWPNGALAKTLMAAIENPLNVYLSLTKRYDSLKSLRVYCALEHTAFYIGATVTNNAQAQAVIDAGGADFISFEPLLEEIYKYPLEKLKCNWWIVGDLTKNGKAQNIARFDWVINILDIAKANDIPVFMKDSLKTVMGTQFVQEFPAEFIRKVGAR